MINNNEKDYSIFKLCENFIRRFKINQLLRESGAIKEKGVSVYDIFAFLLGLIFSGSNLFTTLALHSERLSFGKDVFYRFLKNAKINWEMFLFKLSCAVVPEIKKLTSENRINALIFDDSPYNKNRSKNVELLSKCFDHAQNKFYKGFTLLTMGWSDGVSFVPLMFRLLASSNEKNVYQKCDVKLDKRTLATQRRIDAQTDKPKLVLKMLKAVKGTVCATKHVLFDSWFSSPSLIMEINKLKFFVVSRLKNNDTRYLFEGEMLNLKEIFKKCRKRPGRSRYLLSVPIEIIHKDYDENIPARVVFVRNKNKRNDWIALVSTDTSLTEEEIITLYGKRWDIEPFHKVIKSNLKLEKEFQIRTFDALVAHATVVYTRYIFLSLKSREDSDDRSIGELFHLTCKELDDISFADAFDIIMSIFEFVLVDSATMPKNQISLLRDLFVASLPAYIQQKLACVKCES